MFHKPLDVMFPHPPAGLDPSTLKEESVPQHVAVIMDGNGRWAKKRALNRLKGHQAGIGAVRETIRAIGHPDAAERLVDYVTELVRTRQENQTETAEPCCTIEA